MAKHYIRADITTPKGAPRILYPEGWYENAGKILVRVYDDVNRSCFAELEDEVLFQKLIASGKVTEISAEEMASEVARLRPQPPEARVTLTGQGKEHRAAIEDLLKTKSLRYQIEER